MYPLDKEGYGVLEANDHLIFHSLSPWFNSGRANRNISIDKSRGLMGHELRKP